MSDKQATDAAKDKAQEKGVDLSSVEGSGSGGKVTSKDVEKAQEKSLYRVNPETGSYRFKTYREDGAVKSFYRDPYANPEGLEAQMLTKEEASKFPQEVNGIKVLVPMKQSEGV